MKWTRWALGAVAVLGLALVTAPERAQAFPAGPGTTWAVKDVVDAPLQVRFHGGFHGGFGRFHGGGFRHFGGFGPRRVFFRPRFFHRPRFYAYGPYPYYAPIYRCPVVWTYYGPRRICGYRRHFVRWY